MNAIFFVMPMVIGFVMPMGISNTSKSDADPVGAVYFVFAVGMCGGQLFPPQNVQNWSNIPPQNVQNWFNIPHQNVQNWFNIPHQNVQFFLQKGEEVCIQTTYNETFRATGRTESEWKQKIAHFFGMSKGENTYNCTDGGD